MGVNVINYGGWTLVDMTDATVTEDTLLQGITAYNSEGELIVGTYAGSSNSTRYAVLPASGWIEDVEDYTWRWYQTIAVDGILAADDPFIDLHLEGLTKEQEDSVAEWWASMVKITTSDNAITAYACDLPEVDIPIKIKACGGAAASEPYSGAGAHNSIYRGKYLGSAVTEAQYAAIAAGTFEELYIGDYWTIGGVTYRIAAFDYYYNMGDTRCATHHVTIVPDKTLYNAAMNDSNVVTGAYAGSKMRTEGLRQAKETIAAAFGEEHILTHRNYFHNAATNHYPTGGSWYDADVELMNEIILFGSRLGGNLYNGTATVNISTIETSQFPLFAHRHDMISNWATTFWLRDIYTSSSFLCCRQGMLMNGSSSNVLGVRPAFSIAG